MNNNNYLWEIVLSDIKKEVSDQVFNTWFTNSFIDKVDFNNKKITIISENILISDYLKSVFDPKFKTSLKNNTSIDFDIEYSYIGENKSIIEDKRIPEPSPDSFIKEKFLAKDKPSGMQNFTKQPSFIFEDYKEPEKKAVPLKNNKNKGLNRNFTFDNFVIGEGNNLAYNVALSVVEYPGVHNPFFIYGGVGLGKTHLLHAIGNELEKNNPDFKIECVSSEKFINEFVQSIRSNSKDQNLDEKFRNKYRNVDALLIDDIQFLADKKETQNTFFHTFNELHMNDKQIVLVSDRPPSQLDGLEDRLVSRFDSGVISDITPPDYETRFAIISFKCEKYQLKVDDNIISYIAGNITGNIRELEGVLKEIDIITKRTNKPVTIHMAEDIIKRRVKSSKKKIVPDDIINTTSDFFKISIDDILSSKRNKELVYPRMIAMYLCRELTDLSLPAIGKLFNKDHSSIFYSINKVSTFLNENENNIVDTIENIKEKLNNK